MSDADSVSTPVSFGRVLLPLDGSAFAAAALPTAQALVARFGAALETLCVADDDRAVDELRQQALDSVPEVDPTAVKVVVADDPAEAIVSRRPLESCVVCMSTRGRGRISGAVIGSVAREVLRRCNAPVVAVGPQADRPPALVGRPRRRPAHWVEPLSYPRVVACVDGSPESETVLPEAARWAKTLDMSLSIVTVAEETAAMGRGEQSNRFGPEDPRGYVDELATRWSKVVPNAVAEVLFDPLGVSSGLRAHLTNEPAGLVAVTTHARTGFERVRLGSTAADIVRTSTVPCLVVPLSPS